jgi:hypothetical protein
MKIALQRLSDLTGNPEIASRNPNCPLSFSVTPDEVADESMNKIYSYAEGQTHAFSPLRADGWPIRSLVP